MHSKIHSIQFFFLFLHKLQIILTLKNKRPSFFVGLFFSPGKQASYSQHIPWSIQKILRKFMICLQLPSELWLTENFIIASNKEVGRLFSWISFTIEATGERSNKFFSQCWDVYGMKFNTMGSVRYLGQISKKIFDNIWVGKI